MLLASLGFEQNLFLTFKQAQDIGARINKGEKSQLVLYWKHEKKVDEVTGEEKPHRFLRYYKVFNIVQCTGIPEKFIPAKDELIANSPIETCEMIVESMPKCPSIKMKEARAYYNVEEDFINMPRMKTFKNSASFYGTLFHELIHSTGHQSRLNRKELVERTDEHYSIEELTAEIGACYLLSQAGVILPIENSAAYIQGWLERLRNDKRFIVHASAQAQRASDFILGLDPSAFMDKSTAEHHE